VQAESLFRAEPRRSSEPEVPHQVPLRYPCPVQFIRDAETANAFSKLSRYETAIERSISKVWHGLRRPQADRRTDGTAPPPVAIDVDVRAVTRDEP
jgi:hypothetical protein